jgi:hypothetical protein
MLSPDQIKGYTDIVVSLVGAGGVGALLLAVIGMKKATTETPPPPPAPNVGGAGMAQIGGMLAGEHFGMELLRHMGDLSDATREQARAQEGTTRALRESAEERRSDARRLSERIEHLTERLKDARIP